MEEIYTCEYCDRICKNKNSLVQHEIRCKKNPNRIECNGNNGNMPKHINRWYNESVNVGRYKNGIFCSCELNITNKELEDYKKTHTQCEICGKTIDEAVKWESKFAPKSLCIDHDHNTNEFRGLLCSVCNRQLGWYEKYRENVKQYLEKNKT